jgi:uncharacterized protein YdaU (DUF1376 family)
VSGAVDKKADTWMPLWIGAYLADTMELTTLQHGAYLLLLIAYWRKRKPLVDDDDSLRSITKLERADWKRVRPVLAQFFRIADGVWWHKRVEAEILAADARAKKAKDKAEKAAQARWGGGHNEGHDDPSSDAPSMPEALPKDMHEECPTPPPTPSSLRSDSEAKASAAAAAAGSGEKPERSPEDVVKATVWRSAVAVLQEGGCKSEDMCRSFMGKMVVDYTFPVVKEAIEAAVVAQPADAREYIRATCMRLKGERAADHGKPITVPSKAAEETAAYLAKEAEHAKEAEAARQRRLAAKAAEGAPA